MEVSHNPINKIRMLNRGLLMAFVASLLLSVYFLFSLPSDLQSKGNLQYLDLVKPILFNLYVSLAITATLACVALYFEITNKQTVIVYREKSLAQSTAEKTQADSGSKLTSLNSKSIRSNDNQTLLSESLNHICNKLDAVAGACYLAKEEEHIKFVELVTGFALPLSESDILRFNFGEGIVGQAAKSGKSIYLDEIPEGYIQVVSGLGQSYPKYLLILPLSKNNEVKGILEIATFRELSGQEKQMAEKFAGEIGERLR